MHMRAESTESSPSVRSGTTSRPCVLLARPGTEDAYIHTHAIWNRKGLEMNEITTANEETGYTQRE